MAEKRSAFLQARVRPSALERIDAHVGEEGRSVWLRQLVAWAVESGWRPGQDWVQRRAVTVAQHQAVAEESRAEFAAKGPVWDGPAHVRFEENP